jgi:DNA polymerase I
VEDKFIYGKNPRTHIVCIEPAGRNLVVFYEKDGAITTEILPNHQWMLSDKNHGGWHRLEGELHYKYLKIYDSSYALGQDRRRLNHADLYLSYDPKEANMQLRGLTYFKGMKAKDVSVLSFDIESTGIEHTYDSRVLLISNTFRRGDTLVRKMFAYDDYPDAAAMLDAWCAWVREVDPSIILGHNIYDYDLPYMNFCAGMAGTELKLGRDESAIQFDMYESRFRKGDGQFLTYQRARAFGRELVDTMFLSIRYDIGRKYENYRLKNIIKQEGLERTDRQHYDASTIRDNYKDPVEWAKIKAYAEHDADDALALYDLMVPAYFYLTQSVPKPFQSMMTSASGSQINSFLVRSYLQELHSIPKVSDEIKYEGAISLGNPGVYRNVFKVDVASLYPSIMLEYRVHDAQKDPKAHFLRMVEHFTAERLANKKRAKETSDQYFKDLEQAQKIVINSAYGMMGAPGLNFNSPTNAAFVTEKGREVLTKAMDWALDKGFRLCNADTDSISIEKDATWNADIKQEVLNALNAISPSSIRWEDDGYYPRVLVLKAKNYVLDDGTKLKIKGSALKATTKEKALQEFIKRGVETLLDGGSLTSLYETYAREILTLTDITRWASKKSYTEAVASPSRTNEAKVLAALHGTEYRLGDKFYVYFTADGSLKLAEHWTGDHDAARLLDKLHDTAKVFSTVADLTHCPNYTLKRNKALLAAIA